jgi:Bifunctional DNA primase/polymerase, N-terminal
MRPSEPNALADHARAYAEYGWSVLPLWWPVPPTGDCACGLPDCESAGKHPIRRLVPHGLHYATNDTATVERWWHSYRHANIGIRTGSASGLVVLDVDDEAGRLALRGLVAANGGFDARWVRTGSGGWHAYFAHPGSPVPNSAGRLGEGLDVRGEGGYVVAPPSMHQTNRRYRWARPDDVAELPPMPGWLVELAASPASDHPEALPVRLRTDDAPAYAAAAVEREARIVAAAPPGQRNHQLNRSAFKLGQLVGAGLLDEETITAALVDAGLAAGPGERKIRSTISSGVRAGMQAPRRVVLHTPRTGQEDGTC